MVGWHHWLDGHEFEQALGVGDGQRNLACCSPWGLKELERLSDWTELSPSSVCSLHHRPISLRWGVETKKGVYSGSHWQRRSVQSLSCVWLFDKTWSTGDGNGKPLQYSCLENLMNSMRRQKDKTLKDELPRSVGTQYATGDQWRNNSRKNEEMEPKQKQHPVVNVTGDGSKVWCCKEQYCIGTWNVRSMNQGKLEMVKQEMSRVNIDILGISEQKLTGMGEFNSDVLYIYKNRYGARTDMWARIP